jgi:hypothetical protein
MTVDYRAPPPCQHFTRQSYGGSVSWAWIPFIALVLISGFMVVNMIIAMICDAIRVMHSDQKAMIVGHEEVNRDRRREAPVRVSGMTSGGTDAHAAANHAHSPIHDMTFASKEDRGSDSQNGWL